MAFEGIRGDIAIYAKEPGAWYRRPGFWIAATHRIGAAAHSMPNPPLKYAVLAVHKLLSLPWRAISGVYIPHSTKIGPGLRLPHPRDIYLPPDGEFGAECSIYQEVTVGWARRGRVSIGDRVMLLPGSRVLGGVRIGHDVRVGPNAVVVKDIPDGAVVSPPTVRVIPRDLLERANTDGA